MKKSHDLSDLDLVEKIKNSISSEQIVETELRTDERVIARVTDGIYRQPGSALRELITNAYDADAKRVVVKTDAPRFSRISVEDDGHGMTPEILSYMLLHIGGSAKRNIIGQDLGISSTSNPTLSPGGRFLIGKIGIGIFSVAQLTYRFQIITKVKGDPFRTIASVALRQYSDDGEEIMDDKVFETGKVTIWREKAFDIESHGTSIVLADIRPQARETLQSREIWSSIAGQENSGTDEPRIIPPKYNIGVVDQSGKNFRTFFPGRVDALPWEKGDDPSVAFSKLVQSVWTEIETTNPNPKLDTLFDFYLQTVWNLGLSLPLPYLDIHPFELPLDGSLYAFEVSNEPRGGSREIPNDGKSIRDVLSLKEGIETEDFEVYVDELKLFRPIKFRSLPMSSHALKKSIIFVGKCVESFEKYSKELSGGPLEFEAYLFWTPKVAPTEHRGSLLRVHGASGTLFDQSFFRYQVAELTRLRQITCEIFVHRGFDSALNIDRESFNQAHPHAVFITRWLHNSLRQLATTQKRLAAEVRSVVREEINLRQTDRLEKIASDVWQNEMKDEYSSPPFVSFGLNDRSNNINKPDIEIDLPIVRNKGNVQTNISSRADNLSTEKLRAIVQVLSSFGLLQNLNEGETGRLLTAIYEIIEIAE